MRTEEEGKDDKGKEDQEDKEGKGKEEDRIINPSVLHVAWNGKSHLVEFHMHRARYHRSRSSSISAPSEPSTLGHGTSSWGSPGRRSQSRPP